MRTPENALPTGDLPEGTEPPLLRVLGIGDAPIALTAAALAGLPTVATERLPIVCMSGREVRPARRYEGLRLVDLLRHCGIDALPRPRLKQSLVVCHAHDGYRALFTWHELFNTATGPGVLLIATPGGELFLVSSADLRAGPRNLQRLATVELLQLPA